MNMKFGTLIALVTWLPLSTAANADVIYLQCGGGNFTVDLTNNTVNNLPATINTTAIDWKVGPQVYPRSNGSGNDTVTVFNQIDRVAGTFSSRIQVEFPGGMNTGQPSNVSCTAGSAPATKF